MHGVEDRSERTPKRMKREHEDSPKHSLPTAHGHGSGGALDLQAKQEDNAPARAPTTIVDLTLGMFPYIVR
jgi:hypothetical protein